jgi:hypothetical protein
VTIKRGEVWLADLNPTRGSEQAGATFKVIDPFGGHDVAVEVTLPVSAITWHDWMQLAEITAALEEEYDVYIGLLTKIAT